MMFTNQQYNRKINLPILTPKPRKYILPQTDKFQDNHTNKNTMKKILETFAFISFSYGFDISFCFLSSSSIIFICKRKNDLMINKQYIRKWILINMITSPLELAQSLKTSRFRFRRHISLGFISKQKWSASASRSMLACQTFVSMMYVGLGG